MPPESKDNVNAGVITPRDHFVENQGNATNAPITTRIYDNDNILSPEDHFIRDVNDQSTKDMPVSKNGKAIFSGSTTHINPTGDPEKQKIINFGLHGYESERVTNESNKVVTEPPISPLQPFTRLHPLTAQHTNLTTYNRTKLPIADLEFRKGFRHIFITRPECYIMAHNPTGLGSVLSEQAEYDEDFSSCASRMPHILNLLSPTYVTGSYSNNKINSNWNYLLSNRVDGLSVNSDKIGIYENGSKSLEGNTIQHGSILESRKGDMLELKFRDTKNLEVYEMLRMWMLYIYKRQKGVFAPPYNYYQRTNGFLTSAGSIYHLPNTVMNHPYDRALEYCASIFDIVTNESMTKIIYWCKYYGVYPVSVTPSGLSNTGNAPLTSMEVGAQFKYQYKLENVNRTLVEFNYNAGITDDMGHINKEVEASYPFLLHDDPNDKIKKQYIGAAGMFTGSPYIIMGESQLEPLKRDSRIITPYLQFMSLTSNTVNNFANNNIINSREDTNHKMGIPL